ncbi:UNVERIFIED_CONTAM: E3 ubiquitin-protein ligase RHF2A [Sesamum calycinum]|uniref:E3 ubiquitin-protein ligase RHF2A n=1 Tax=Sesamum calycinum TaxID=2727403 RepID=A0AAW2SE36_9LAMI
MEEEKVAQEEKVSENHLTSAAAFVEGGIQEACDDACSICLEAFCDSDPSTMDWNQLDPHLPNEEHLDFQMQGMDISLFQVPEKLPVPNVLATNQFEGSKRELLEAVEHERNMRMNPPRNTTIFHHPTLGDFELQHLPVSASELEERIIQHLAAAAAMGRARQLARREGQRSRSSAQGRPHFLVFSTHPNGTSTTSSASSVAQRDGSGPPPAVMIAAPNSPFITVGEDSAQFITRPSSAQADQLTTTASGSSPGTYQQGTSSSNRRSPAQTSPSSQDRAGPSDLQSFSESLKSRLSALSTRYKESITKSTRGWKDRLFARNSSTPEPPTEVRREFDPNMTPPQGIATVSRMMDHLEIAEDGRTDTPTASSNSGDSRTPDATEQQTIVMGGRPSLSEDDSRAPCPAGPASN